MNVTNVGTSVKRNTVIIIIIINYIQVLYFNLKIKIFINNNNHIVGLLIESSLYFII